MEEVGIHFFSENDFQVDKEDLLGTWLRDVLKSENKKLGNLNYIFCSDEYLLGLNQKFLNHDTYTDVIGFPEVVGSVVGGDIFISTDRVQDNAREYGVSEDEELRRVLVHGLLHFCGYKDKTADEETAMRELEDEKLKMFHVEQ